MFFFNDKEVQMKQQYGSVINKFGIITFNLFYI